LFNPKAITLLIVLGLGSIHLWAQPCEESLEVGGGELKSLLEVAKWMNPSPQAYLLISPTEECRPCLSSFLNQNCDPKNCSELIQHLKVSQQNLHGKQDNAGLPLMVGLTDQVTSGFAPLYGLELEAGGEVLKFNTIMNYGHKEFSLVIMSDTLFVSDLSEAESKTLLIASPDQGKGNSGKLTETNPGNNLDIEPTELISMRPPALVGVVPGAGQIAAPKPFYLDGKLTPAETKPQLQPTVQQTQYRVAPGVSLAKNLGNTIPLARRGGLQFSFVGNLNAGAQITNHRFTQAKQVRPDRLETQTISKISADPYVGLFQGVSASIRNSAGSEQVQVGAGVRASHSGQKSYQVQPQINLTVPVISP
jgi:hypothetical protein